MALPAPYAPPQHPAPIDLRLDANEGPAPPASWLAALPTIDAEALRRYPRSADLQRELAARHSVEPERVVVTAGADDAIDRICRAFLGPGQVLVLPTPTFEMIPRYAALAGAPSVPVDWPGGAFPVREVLSAAREAAMIAIVSPNNPTGAVARRDDLLSLARGCPDAIILLDAAYGEFADEDLTPAALSLSNLIVTRTLSKAWGLAGLRVGYAIAPPELAPRVRAVGGPYGVSSFSMALARARLRDAADDVRAYVERVRDERAALATHLRALGADALPSQANFVLARFSDPVWVRDALAGLGIGVRIFPDRPELSAHLRITCPGSMEQAARLHAALAAALRPETILVHQRAERRDLAGEPIIPSGASLERLRRRVRVNLLANPALTQAEAAAAIGTALQDLGTERAWLLSDAPGALRAARAAGIVPIGMLPRSASADAAAQLMTAGASRVIADLATLEEMLP